MILNRQRTVRVARPPLEAFLARVREQLRLNGAEITVCLVSDPAIAHMNETFRHKKGPTDVLSFPSSVAPASLPAFFPSTTLNDPSREKLKILSFRPKRADAFSSRSVPLNASARAVEEPWLDFSPSVVDE
jgi:Endoribonuclease YbeY